MATVVDRSGAIPGAREACRRAAEEVLGRTKVVVAIVDDATIAELHERYLGVPGATDVLSFPHGEIVVSAETALREARERRIEARSELCLYVVHGALHLKGFDDRTPRGRGRMRAEERRILGRLGLGDVFAAAAKGGGRRRPRR